MPRAVLRSNIPTFRELVINQGEINQQAGHRPGLKGVGNKKSGDKGAAASSLDPTAAYQGDTLDISGG